MDLFKNFDLVFFLTSIGILISIIALYSTKASIRKLNFNLFVWQNKTVLTSQFVNQDYVEIKNIKSKEQSIHELVLYFKNEGNTTLENKDILENIKIKFNNCNDFNILEAHSFSSNKYSDCKLLNLEDNIIGFNFDNLEKNDYLKIIVIYASKEQCSGEISGKIKGIAELSESFKIDSEVLESMAGYKYENRLTFVAIAFGLAFFCQSYLFIKTFNLSYEVVYKRFNYSFFNLFYSSEGWLILLFLIINLIISLFCAKYIHRLITPYHWIISSIREWNAKDKIQKY